MLHPQNKKLHTLTSSLFQGNTVTVLSRLWLLVFRQLSQWGQLSLLILFALAALVAALRFSLRFFPSRLLLSAWGGRFLPVIVENILLLLQRNREATAKSKQLHHCVFFWNHPFIFKSTYMYSAMKVVFEKRICPLPEFLLKNLYVVFWAIRRWT